MTDIIVEITGVGGATNLQALTDTNIVGAADGQVLTYDNATSKWIPTAASGVSTIGALNDVNLTGIADGNVIKWDAGNAEFIVAADDAGGQVTSVAGRTGAVVIVKADIADFGTYATTAQGTLADSALQPLDNISSLINDSNFADDQTGAEIKVAYESEADTNAFTNLAVSTLTTALQDITNESINDLPDVDLTTVAIANGDLIQWNSTGSKFIPVSPLDLPQPTAAPADISASSIDDLSDVFANEYTDGMVLRANGLVFHDSFLDYSDLTGTPTITDWTAASQGTIDSTNLPGLALTDINTVADETAQLALTAQEGDVAIRTDENKTYAHNGGGSGTMADWSELLTPTDIVTSVAGKTGVVTLAKADITDFVETDYATGAEGDLATSALQDIVTDTTPQLGGDLDVVGNSITNAAADGLNFEDYSTGSIKFNFEQGKVDASCRTTLYGNSYSTTRMYAGWDGTNYLQQGAMQQQYGGTPTTNCLNIYTTGERGIEIGTAYAGLGCPVTLGAAALIVPGTDGTAGQAMTTDGSGNLGFSGEKIYDVALTTTDATVTTAQSIFLTNGRAASFSIMGFGKELISSNTYGFTLSGCVSNNFGTLAIVGSNLLTKHQSAGAAAWSITATANDTTDELEIKVTGEAGRTINWNFTIRTVEV